MFKNLFFSFFLSLFLTLSLYAEEYSVIQDENVLKILTPSIAKREALKIKLKNNLEAYLISDPDLDKSGAGLAVNVGSWSNPKESLGMAHFLEHMLFLGTKKYPSESGFATYLDEHGGMHNAFTDNDKTVFMFSVNNEDFAGALDQFAHFFIDPLFNHSGVCRESNAIDQEYAKNLQNDSWRLYHVRKALENKEHPDSQFSMGSLETISKISPEALREWYNTHYSANLMHLVIYSTLPMDKLVELVVTDFGPIVDKSFTVLNIDLPLFSSTSKENIIYIKPYQDIRELILQWEVPASYRYDAKVLSYALGYEHRNSLTEILKKEGLAEELLTATELYTPKLIFTINVSLTEKGVEQIDKVIYRCFQAINFLKENGIPKSLYNEMKELSTLSYEYQSRKDVFSTVMKDADNMIDEPLATYPLQTYIPTKYSPTDLLALMELLSPESALYFVLADEKLTHVPPTITEPWLKAEYATVPISKEKLASWAKAMPNLELQLPPTNPFIPQNLHLNEASVAAHTSILTHPKLILDNTFSKLYYAKDDRFLIPSVAASFRIHTANKKPGHAKLSVLLDLYLKALENEVRSLSYQGMLASLNFNTLPIEDGLSITISGYSEKAPLFFKDMIAFLRQVNPTDEEFLIYKDSLAKEYMNSTLEPPLQQAKEFFNAIIFEKYITDKKKASALVNLTKKDLLNFVSTLYSKTYVEGIVYGNLSEIEALELNTSLQDVLKSVPLGSSNIAKKKVLQLNQEEGPYKFVEDVKQFGNAICLAIEDGCYTIKKRVMLQLLSKGLEAAVFDELRTKQQTGYLVGSFDKELERELLLFFYIQSNTHSSLDLLARFELFLENTLRNFQSDLFTEKRFETIRDALLVEFAKSPKNLFEMTAILESLSFDYEAAFDIPETKIQKLKEVTYEEFLDFTKNFIGRNNRRRLAVLVNGILPKENAFSYTLMTSLKQVRKSGIYLNAQENLCQESVK